jgi:hypothetical protein
MYCYDHPKAGVGAQYDVVNKTKSPEKNWKAPISEPIKQGRTETGLKSPNSGTHPASGVNGTFQTDRVDITEDSMTMVPKTVQVVQLRTMVMKKKQETSVRSMRYGEEVTITKDAQTDSLASLVKNLQYRQEYYPTELQYVLYQVFYDESKFEKALQDERENNKDARVNGKKTDPQFRQNVLLILWKGNRVERYALDGVELYDMQCR